MGWRSQWQRPRTRSGAAAGDEGGRKTTGGGTGQLGRTIEILVTRRYAQSNHYSDRTAHHVASPDTTGRGVDTTPTPHNTWDRREAQREGEKKEDPQRNADAAEVHRTETRESAEGMYGTCAMYGTEKGGDGDPAGAVMIEEAEDGERIFEAGEAVAEVGERALCAARGGIRRLSAEHGVSYATEGGILQKHAQCGNAHRTRARENHHSRRDKTSRQHHSRWATAITIGPEPHQRHHQHHHHSHRHRN